MTDRRWLERQALHDPLTRLPNRVLLMDRARQALARLHRSQGVVAMMFIDLDKFKAVNDNLGHDVGDRLLVSVAGRLAELMRDSDTVARLGGDEFVILAEDLESEEEALALAERVLDALERPFALGKAEVAMLASAGVSVSHSPDADPEAMLREADLAMYRAKNSGERRLALFDESLRREVSTQVEIEDRLRSALPRRELLLAYQPIVPLAGGHAVGAEALVRWNPGGGGHPADGELLPSVFLPPAEESELIVQIGRWVLHAACEQAETWRRNGISIPISVNVSARELTELDLAERVREELAYCRLPGRALCIEVSEEAVKRDPERARAALKDVKRLGVTVALDRFGSGQYSLGLPSNMPLDAVKLDRVLVGSFDRGKEHRAMFAATIALAKEAGLTAIAVGIETKRQLALARAARLLDRAGFSAARTGRPRPCETQGVLRDANVRAVASPCETARQRAPALSRTVSEREKAAAAVAAAALLQDGMRVGLGTGSTVAHLLPAIAARSLSGLRCVATSPATETAARELGLDVPIAR